VEAPRCADQDVGPMLCQAVAVGGHRVPPVSTWQRSRGSAAARKGAATSPSCAASSRVGAISSAPTCARSNSAERSLLRLQGLQGPLREGGL